MEIDGSVFSAGLKALNADRNGYPAEQERDVEWNGGTGSDEYLDLQNTARSATFLINGASLRSKTVNSGTDRFSLNICSRGELVDMYHDRDATDPRDMIYALLGMADAVPVGLEPDYGRSWESIFSRLAESFVGG